MGLDHTALVSETEVSNAVIPQHPADLVDDLVGPTRGWLVRDRVGPATGV